MVKNILQAHPQWKEVFEICHVLKARGFQAVLAGGCVRDACLGKMAKDLDVATNATPEQVEVLFEKVVMVGKNFGVCRVVFAEGSEPIEVATFREEFDYKDGRHPERVVFSSMEKDCMRRDFTINAMFFDPFQNKVLDFVGGEKDLHDKILRTVGSPVERFQEDSLRLLRAARFAAQMELTIEKSTEQAIQQCAADLHRVSRERWQDEVNKAFGIDRPYLFFKKLRELNLETVLFKDWAWNQKSFESFFSQPVEKKWGWSAFLFLQTSQKESRALDSLAVFKLSQEWTRFSKTCLQMKMFLFAEKPALSTWIPLMKEPVIEEVLDLWKRLGRALGFQNPEMVWLDFLKKYAPSGRLPEPVITGQDLILRKIPPGPEFGRRLEEAYLLQLEQPQMTKKEVLDAIV